MGLVLPIWPSQSLDMHQALSSGRMRHLTTGRPCGSRRPVAKLCLRPKSARIAPGPARADGNGTNKSSSKGAAPGVANVLQKAAWYGVEAFGKVASKGQQESHGLDADPPSAKMDRKEVLEAIRRDYEVNNYFVSGQGDMASYEPDCEFSDPFVSFRGVERFKSNVSNLGAYLCATKTMNCLPMWTKGPGPNAMPTLFQTDVDLKILDWKETSNDVDVRWKFSCTIDLPWKPRLAAAGGTTHVFSPRTGKIVRHIERWDVEIDRVLKSLLVPANRLPTNRWEVFMLALSAGDVRGMWLAVSGYVVAPAALLLLGNAVFSIASGREGIPILPAGICWALLLLACTSEAQKLMGVGTSNGGKGGGDTL